MAIPAGSPGKCADCGVDGIVGNDLSLSGPMQPFKLRCRPCRARALTGLPTLDEARAEHARARVQCDHEEE